MNRWLEIFAYHVEIHWSIFVIAFAIAMAIAWLTVSYESIKAAIANPAKSLRDE
jgi:ABC-type antimicrobial peptide transport system permease subunit